MLIGVPVFIVICGLAVYLFFINGIDLSAIIIEMHRMATTPVLVAIPLFTFAGYLLSESGAPKRLIRLSNAVLGLAAGRTCGHCPDLLCDFYGPDRGHRPDHHRPGWNPAAGNDPGKISGSLLTGPANHLGNPGIAFPPQPAPDPLCHRRQGQN